MTWVNGCSLSLGNLLLVDDEPTLLIPPVMFGLGFLFLLIGVEEFVFTI